MTTSTIERAYQLARAGAAPDVVRLKERLKADGCRAVDALLAPRSIRGHLEAICAAAYAAHRSAPPDSATPEFDNPEEA
ncbi:hypothetical protein [Phenylobacterium sp. SCN 70-31]|uniref:hypothetical protein n=1 Tax=Phenylobacterium sp. SCN 70-31 TaxID=1660129 RepID=UPI00086BB6CF|nr:hypothetical protein [Phenylobacterium sp. SCN 70-31]ODT87272.1 MAG: hypothetical protein ABS78_12725 [Phenylobacterium sp. SCN 70-31]